MAEKDEVQQESILLKKKGSQPFSRRLPVRCFLD